MRDLIGMAGFTAYTELRKEHRMGKGKLFLILFSFFLIRLIYCYFFGWNKIPSIGDANTYNGYALAILNESDWLTNPSFIGEYRPPGYPVFLAFIYFIFGAEQLFAVYFFQSIISTLSVYYIFKLSSSMFGERTSLLALFWGGVSFLYLWYNGMILRETIVIFLMILSFYHLWVFFENKKMVHCLKNKDLLAFAVSFTFLLHTDARYLFYIPFLAILFVIYSNFWKGVKDYSWVLAMLILLLVPWTIRNYIAYDGFVLINTRTIDARQKSLSMRTKQLSVAMVKQTENKNYPSEQERALIKKGQNPNNRLPEEIAIIKKDVYPASTFLGRKLYRFKEMWIPFRTWSDYEPFPGADFRGPWSLRHNISSLIFYGTLIPFFFVGISHLFKTRNKAVWFLLFPIAIQALLHFLMWGRDRYRMPIDAFIIILGCYGISAIYGRFKKMALGS